MEGEGVRGDKNEMTVFFSLRERRLSNLLPVSDPPRPSRPRRSAPVKTADSFWEKRCGKCAAPLGFGSCTAPLRLLTLLFPLLGKADITGPSNAGQTHGPPRSVCLLPDVFPPCIWRPGSSPYCILASFQSPPLPSPPQPPPSLPPPASRRPQLGREPSCDPSARERRTE